MIKRILALACAMMLAAAPLALSEQPTKSFGQDVKAWGQSLGDQLSAFGDQIKKFSEDPEAYLTESGLIDSIEQKAKDAGQSIKDYWPTFKASVQGSVEAIMDSDISWDEKKLKLEEYGELALPFLADVDFEQMGEEAKQALLGIKSLMGFETDAEAKKWVEDNKQRLQELRDYLTS